MDELIVSERESAFRYIAYTAGALSGCRRTANTEIRFQGGRVILCVRAGERALVALRAPVEDRIAEVYCVG